MSIQFIIDSASDILPAEAEALGLTRLPLTVTFADQEYSDGVDLSPGTFYEKLVESDVLPTTSQLTPAGYEAAYRKITANGDIAVVITLSSKLSGTYQSAVIAAEDYAGKVFVVDSENVCIGERILILRALELRKQGCSAEEIVGRLNEEKQHIRLLAALDTLEYLKKGGRISAVTALSGTLLSIKPVISVENGSVSIAGKARGSKSVNNLLRTMICNCGGIDYGRPFCLAYSGLSDALLQKYISDSADLWRGHTDSLPVSIVGSVIGTHAGPGAIAVAFFERNGSESSTIS